MTMSMNLQKPPSAKRELDLLFYLVDVYMMTILALSVPIRLRDQTTILVLEDSRDVGAMENIQEYQGLYHVLHGLISPMNGISPDDINLKSLMTRLMDSEVSEVIVATNATADGEATSMYLSATQTSWDQRLHSVWQ